MNSIAVFCGANKGFDPKYEAVTRELGRAFVQRGIRAVYGGGSVGLMGVLADEMLAHGGVLKGIITEQLNNLELGHPGVTDMTVVDSMSERRRLLLHDTDGVITLPGGYGSMDEHFEALTLAQLRLYPKPVGLLNVDGYYDPLLAMMDGMVKAGFLRAQNRELCLSANTVPELLDQMSRYEYKALDKWH
jgi:uncharacterized protein (TIGR00730 family)